MEDKRTIESIYHEIQVIDTNNSKSIDSIVSMEMLLNSNNNCKSKDRDMSKKLEVLKGAIQEAVEVTSQIKSMLTKN